MFDQSVRVAWLDELWQEMRKLPAFQGCNIPQNVCVSVGFPPTRARGKRGDRAAGYFTGSNRASESWKGNASEQEFVCVHPERMKDGMHAAKGMFETLYKSKLGYRSYNRLSQREIESQLAPIVERLGEPPAGYAEMSNPVSKQGTRLRKFECACQPPVIVRVGRDKFDARCNTCKSNFTKA